MNKILYPLVALLLCTQVFFSQQTTADEDQMITHFNAGLSQMYVSKDSAYVNFEKASVLAKNLEDYDSLLGVLDHVVITCDYHDDITKYQAILKKMDSLITNEKIRAKIKNLHYWENAYMGKLGIFYMKTKKFIRAKDVFLKIISDWNGIPLGDLSSTEAQMLYSINGYLGTIYRDLAKYDLAEQYYLSNLSLVAANDEFASYRDSYRNGVQQMLAQLYTQIGQHAKANPYYQQNLQWSKEYFDKDEKYKYNLINAYQKITESYIAQDSLQKALSFLEESRPYLRDDPFLNEVFVLYGDIYLGMQDFDLAFSNYRKALEFIIENKPNQVNQGVAEVHGKIAQLHLKQKNYQEGLQRLEKAFNAAGNNIHITDILQNPDPELVFSKTQLLQLLDVKLQLLQGRYQETSDTTYQEASLQTSHGILETFDLLKSEFESKLDKQFLAENAYPIFHRLLETAYKLYEKEPSEKMVELSLNIAEKNKDFILLEVLRNAQATEYGNVPQEVLDKEARLRAEITLIEKQIFNAPENKTGFSEALFSLKQDYYNFLDTIKTNYPKYHELKYLNVALRLKTVRNEVLDDNSALISFTMTKNYLYAIVLGNSKEKILKIPFSGSDKDNIREFYKLLSSPSINNSQKAISDLGRTLYVKILQKPLADIETQNLTIIPDGELHYLPFDLLQKNGSYLLETKNIGYGNSITSLLELRAEKKSAKNQVLAFAPIFTDNSVSNADREFGKLFYNDDEVSKIAAFYDTETLMNDQATLANFKAKTGNFNVLHLATHASANDEYPDYSYLAFTQPLDSTESNILYIKDLYDMTLHADMVTLSACQTGIGKLQKGQGMMSLSKGFYYAGAKSLVNTLWKINDKSTVSLMAFFYEGLSEGKSKTKALRDAKLKYLETTDDDLLKHPYYWAAFTVSGNVAPLQDKKNIWWWLSLLPIIAFGAWLVTRK